MRSIKEKRYGVLSAFIQKATVKMESIGIGRLLCIQSLLIGEKFVTIG